MAAVGHDEQPPVAAPAGPAARPGRPARTGRGRRRRPASGAVIAAQLARRSAAAGPRRPAAIAGSRRCQAPAPWTGSCVPARSAAQAGSSRRIRSGSMSRRATLARGSRCGRDPDDDERPRRAPAQRAANPSAVIAPIEKPQQVEGRQAEGVDEGRRGRRRATRRGTRRRRPSASGRGRARRAGRRGTPSTAAGDLRREVLAPGRGRAVEHDQRRPGADRRRSRSRGRWRGSSAPSSSAAHRLSALRLAFDLGRRGALDAQVAAPVVEQRHRVLALVGQRRRRGR